MLNLDEFSRGGTICFSKAGLKIGNSDAKDVDIAAPNGAGVDFAINGVVYHKADAADIAITAATAQGLLRTCIYLVCLSTAGALTTVKGTAQLTADLVAGNEVLDFPQPTADTCCIGYLHVVTASSANFTAGTTDLDASNVTTTYVDVTNVPVAPLTS